MTCRGTVQGGVVILENGIALPDGTEVTISIPNQVEPYATEEKTPSVWKKMAHLARWAESQPCTLPNDLASNHDHHLHGLPKRK